MKKLHLLLAVVIVALAGISFAQEPAKEASKAETNAQTRPLSFYKVEYVLRELQDGKAINSRNYMMTIEDRDWGEAKVGARVPVNTGGGGPSMPTSQWQYMDIGINIRCRPVGMNDFTSLQTTVEISSFALPEKEATASQPVVRQMKTDMAAVVPNGKQTVIGVIDDVNSTKRYEIAVTATRLK